MKILVILCSSFLVISCSHQSDVTTPSGDIDTQATQTSLNSIDAGVSTFNSQEVSIDIPVDSINPSTRP